MKRNKDITMNYEDNKLICREDLLEAYIRYTKHRGKVRVLLKRCLEAILAAFNPDLDLSLLKYFNSGILIDENCSKSKLKEIEGITGFRFDEEKFYKPLLNSIEKRQEMFESLLVYRLQLEEIADAYDGFYKYNGGFQEGWDIAQKVTDKIEPVIIKVDKILFLLLGDKYDKSFTMSELKEKYGYPDISKQELRQAIINDLYD